MPVNGMNVGRDYAFGLYDQNTGAVINLGDVQSVKITAVYHDIKSSPYNSTPKFGHVPDGFKGTITIVRTGAQLETLQLQLNAAFNAGTSMLAGFLNETVTNADGSVSRFQYTGVDFKIVEIADVSREKVVQQTVEFLASDKVPIA